MAQVGHQQRTGVCPGLTRGAQIAAALIVALALTFAQGPVSGASSRTHVRKPFLSTSLRVKKPGQPTDVASVGGNDGATISWNAPVSNGGAPVTAYVVTMSHHQGCWTTSATTCTVTGLTNGTLYRIRVRASNSVGEGKWSAPVTVQPSDAPDCSYFGPDADLSGCDLSGITLSGVTLNHVNLTNANLTNANLQSDALTDVNLTSANLTSADLNYAVLDNVDLSQANMNGTFLVRASSQAVTGTPAVFPTGFGVAQGYLVGPSVDLTNANLAGANLTNADLLDSVLTGASLNGTSLSGADLAGATSGGIVGRPTSLPNPWLLAKGYLIGPSASLVHANLTGANLTGADLTQANLTDAILTNANLTSATFEFAALTGVISGGVNGTQIGLYDSWSVVSGYLIGPGANLEGAQLSGSDMFGNDLDNADLSNANLSGVNLGFCSAVGADLNNVNLNGATLAFCDLTDASFTAADLTGVNLARTTATGATFSNATWSNTVCPDSSNSDSDGDTCVNNLG